eukprot:TRINITY_DN72567_c0_g1_i1.p1 TRINITY_DN72567_c0_g1~~TRINITY_DN72567_c0_g1_i1.p1  ORF type:complete len:100 (+),score=0.19 TRINITY_DN72567_c0_g1_i1:131-430(+)
MQPHVIFSVDSEASRRCQQSAGKKRGTSRQYYAYTSPSLLTFALHVAPRDVVRCALLQSHVDQLEFCFSNVANPFRTFPHDVNAWSNTSYANTSLNGTS